MVIPKYKLIYFDFRSKAEPLRWIFKYAGVPFEDVRIQETPHYISPEPAPEWDRLKPSVPYNQLPVLEVDGKYLGQTQAIARYLAQQFDLLGKNDWEASEADALASYLFSEVEPPYMAIFREKDPVKKQELQKKYQEELLPSYLGTLEELLKKNGNGNGFFVGDSVTWMDFVVAGFFERLINREKAVLNQFPRLHDHYKRILALPGVKEWILSRPNQPF